MPHVSLGIILWCLNILLVNNFLEDYNEISPKFFFFPGSTNQLFSVSPYAPSAPVSQLSVQPSTELPLVCLYCSCTWSHTRAQHSRCISPVLSREKRPSLISRQQFPSCSSICFWHCKGTLLDHGQLVGPFLPSSLDGWVPAFLSLCSYSFPEEEICISLCQTSRGSCQPISPV